MNREKIIGKKVKILDNDRNRSTSGYKHYIGQIGELPYNAPDDTGLDAEDFEMDLGGMKIK